MPQNQPLTFEQFIEGEYILGPDMPPLPRYNNFPLHFTTRGIGVSCRELPYFKRFQTEQPDLERRLTEAITNRDRTIDTSSSFKPFEPELYQAYLIMKDYGVSDTDLFL